MMAKKKECYIFSDGEGSCFAARVSDDKIVGTGHMLVCLKADMEIKGYNVVAFPQDEADEEMEYGFRD